MSLPWSKRSPDTGFAKLVVSLHDVSALSWQLFDGFLHDLSSAGVQQTSLLVVPRWHGGPPVSKKPEFVTWLHDMSARGHDICLHGNTHQADKTAESLPGWFMSRVYTAGEGEFFKLSESDAYVRIIEGLDILRSAGLTVHGFTPPAWLLSAGARTAARRAGLFYTTTFNHVELLQEERSVFAPIVALSCRNMWRRHVSRVWTRLWSTIHSGNPILRIAVHPIDLLYPQPRACLLSLIERAMLERHACSYKTMVMEESQRTRCAA